MIYTVTLNPALDRTLWVNKVRQDDSNRIDREQSFAGGKGVDVSKVLTAFGVDSRAIGFVGGFAGDELEGMLLNEGVPCEFVRIKDETRTNIIISDMSRSAQTVFNAKGPQVRPYELMLMIHKLEQVEKADFVIISGSLPRGVNPEIYRKIIDITRGNGIRAILDADGDALKVGLHGRPFAIKPNVRELARLVGHELRDLDGILEAARGIAESGVENVLVSMGPKGMLLVSGEGEYLAEPPEVEVVNTVGAGDSAVAGFAYGLSGGKSLTQSLAYAVAAGTATTMRPGTALCRLEDIEEILPRVTVRGADGRTAAAGRAG